MTPATLHIARRAVAKIVLGLCLIATSSVAALAVDLAFSADCRNHQAINAASVNTGILFRKNPNSAITRAANATVFDINNAHNVIIQGGTASCFYAIQGNNSYCFLARSVAGIQNINAVAGNNHLGAPACQ